MKKLFIAMGCICMLSLTAFTTVVSYAQSAGTESKMKEKDGEVMMKDGKMMIMKNGKWEAMTATATMSNGTKVMTDGSVMMKDGKKKMLKNGECMMPDGMMKKM
jgi:hypothetical protein